MVVHTVTLYPEDFSGPHEWVKFLKTMGFRFDSESCPIRLSDPRTVTENEDGSVTYTQQIEL